MQTVRMSPVTVKQLHWRQRIALVRHNLHSASRSRDFGFFKALQAAGLMDGTNHFATLTAIIGDDADTLLAALDNLNGALGLMHQDAFQAVYDNLKNTMRDDDKEADKSKLYVDITMQKNKAEMAIDKLSNSAIALIEQQPAHAQDTAANVYVTGITLVADCVEVMIRELESIDQKMDDFIRLEESWNTVKASVLAASAGLKGVFYMLDQSDPQGDKVPRNMSISSASSALFRRMSSAFQSPPSSRSSSIAGAGVGASRNSISGPGPVYRTPNYVRNSISAGCPISMPASSMMNFESPKSSSFRAHHLNTIPPTPAGGFDEEMDPFDTTSMSMPSSGDMPFSKRRMSQAVM